MNNTRRIVHYSGHVQGVGFRFRTLGIARRFDVAGYVQNLSDGRVRVDVQGATREVDGFLAAVQQAMDGYIDDVEMEQRDGDVDVAGFEIRH